MRNADLAWKFNGFVYAHILCRAWVNDEFKKRLFENPSEVLKANGFALPKMATVRIEEGIKNTSWNGELKILTLPYVDNSNMPDAELLSCDIDKFAWILNPRPIPPIPVIVPDPPIQAI